MRTPFLLRSILRARPVTRPTKPLAFLSSELRLRGLSGALSRGATGSSHSRWMSTSPNTNSSSDAAPTDAEPGATAAAETGTVAGEVVTEIPREASDAGSVAGDEKTGDTDPETELQAELAQAITTQQELQDKFDQMQNFAARVKADLENAKINHGKALERARQNASEAFAKEMIIIADNLTLALNSVPEDATQDAASSAKVLESLVEGVKLTNASLAKAFDNVGLEKIESLGQVYDPAIQSPLQRVHDAAPEGTIIAVLREGYRMGTKVVRTAQVVTSRGPAEAATDADDST